MALPLPQGLVPAEVAFVCEMELVTVVPRQRLEPINLLSGMTTALRPPHRAQLPLWLALLLKKQRRANIVPPPWLHPASLQEIVNHETTIEPAAFSPPPPPPMRSDGHGGARSYGRNNNNNNNNNNNSYGSNPDHKPGDLLLSPPFLPSCTADAPSGHLPYHWLEVSETLLAHAADDIPAAAEVRTLLRDLQEVRAAKMRGSTTQLQAGDGVVPLRGVGAMELSEARGFVSGVVEGVRKLGASAEATRREEEEERARDGGGDDSEDEMDFE